MQDVTNTIHETSVTNEEYQRLCPVLTVCPYTHQLSRPGRREMGQHCGVWKLRIEKEETITYAGRWRFEVNSHVDSIIIILCVRSFVVGVGGKQRLDSFSRI